MQKALKVTMVVFGVVEILFGLGFTFLMPKMLEMMGFEPGPDYLQYVGALLGLTLIVVSAFIIAAARDPLRHISWVRFSILWCISGVIAGVYSVVRNYVDFSQAGMGAICAGIVAIALLVFYPWRRAGN